MSIYALISLSSALMVIVLGAIVYRDRKQAQENIKHMANHDYVTGLPNRLLFKDRLDRALSTAKRDGQKVGLLYLDVDRFKLINDEFGHSVGDLVLKTAGARISACLREADTVARFGSDEFLVILPNVKGAAGARDVVEKISLETAKRIRIADYDIETSVSIGISLYPDDAQDPETLVTKAESALRQAKEDGLNKYHFFSRGMTQTALGQARLEKELRQALEREQFVVYYQPVVDIKTGRIISAEALVRWRHPKRGLVFPKDFIDPAEHAGLIIPIGEWVLSAACAQNKAWQESGLRPITVSVNLSAKQLRDHTITETVFRMLEKSALEPRYLSLELTETAIMENPEFCAPILEALTAGGIDIVLDDFGTGYSSLTSLRRYPIKVLKIDRGFIDDITVDPEDAALVRGVIGLANSMGLKVVAEGVETDEQVAWLRAEKSQAIQGFIFSPAVPAEEFELFLREERRLPDVA
jgi:diguanylate cyclase (GGDEF)-like protein